MHARSAHSRPPRFAELRGGSTSDGHPALRMDPRNGGYTDAVDAGKGAQPVRHALLRDLRLPRLPGASLRGGAWNLARRS